MDWKKVAWLNRGKRRKDILRIFSQASITVHELYDLGLISCKNPNDKIGKLFEITEKGTEILKYITGS